MSEGLGDVVKSHYNSLQETGLNERKLSRIYYMRNFNNWIKSMSIGLVMDRLKEERDLKILDLASGKGGDLLKWNKYKDIKHIVFTDIADTSVVQCEQRYKSRRYNSYGAEFIAADATKSKLKELFKDKDMKFNMTSCQFALHYGFESLSQAKTMLHNACAYLKPGGYFLGTIPNDYEIIRRLNSSESGKGFSNEVFSINFPDGLNKNLFGSQYMFHLEGVVDCPEFLVHFPLLVELAKDFDMELVFVKPFDEFYVEQIRRKEGRDLITWLKGLEPYPSTGDDKLCAPNHDSYKTAKESEADIGKIYGTLSIEEWKAITIYQVFLFQKKKISK